MHRKTLFTLTAAAALAGAAPALAAESANPADEPRAPSCCERHATTHEHHAAPRGADAKKASRDEARPSLLPSDAEERNALNGSNGG